MIRIASAAAAAVSGARAAMQSVLERPRKLASAAAHSSAAAMH